MKDFDKHAEDSNTALEAQLQETVGLKPLAWDPLRFLDAAAVRTDLRALDGIKGHFAIASGLALR